MMLVGALVTGWMRRVALASTCLTVSKAVVVSSVHAGESEGRLVCLRIMCSGCRRVVPFEINL